VTRVIGQPFDRIDGKKKVTGAATYAADTDVANVLHAVIVTSTIGKGTIHAIDDAAAKKAPGVVAVLHHGNAPKLPPSDTNGAAQERVLQLLQDAEVRYQDQPIAVVVADTIEHAQGGAALVTATYASEAAAARLENQLGDAFAPKKAGPREPAASARGDLAAGLTAADKTFEAVYRTPIENHNPMEPHATVAVWHGKSELTLYDSTQGVFGVRSRMAKVFGLEPNKVRVINAFVGGGFGCKGSAWSHVGLCALAAKAVDRPVKLVVTRQQMFSLVGHRPETIQTIKLGAKADGTLTAISHDVISETSRFDEFSEPSALVTRMLYACPNVTTSHKLVRLDIPTPTFMRAPGESTGTFAIESALDELAVALAIDPLTLRMKNYALQDPDKGKPFSSKSLRECYMQAAAKFGWASRPPRPRATVRSGKLVGWGMATATYPSYIFPASAKVELRADGTALVLAGTQDLGTGTYTIMTQIAADTLGLPLDKVTFDLGDTTYPPTGVSGGSTTAASVGSAIKLACIKAKAALPAALAKGEQKVTVEHHYEESDERKKYSTHAFGADFVEVEVDEDLGSVRVLKMVAAFAAGTILNAKTARSQFMGGLVWAVGMALQEHTVRDPRTARAAVRDLADYHVPVNADIPDIDIIMIPEDDPHVNDLGAKGIGEIGITGATAAIANAIYHATGKRIRELPITLDKLVVG
jgi:xanthine dehydrogenase YagR molybdenum-binding subunit